MTIGPIPLLLVLAASTFAAAGDGSAPTRQVSATPVSEGYFPGADGVRLFYRRVGNGREILVYLHGGPGSNFRGNGDQLEALAVGRTLILYDQRGSGRSQIVADRDRLGAQDHVRDLEALRRYFGFRRMSLIGLSWGSGLAALYAAQHPRRVPRLLLISPMPPTRLLFDERLARLNILLDPASRARRTAIGERIRAAADEEAFRLCRESSDITFRLYLAAVTAEKLNQAARRCDIPPAAIRNRPIVETATIESLGTWDFRPMLGRLRMPALVLEGAESNVPLDATRSWAAALPNARLLLVAGAGHELFLDRPEPFQAAAEIFLRGGFPDGAVAPGR